MKLSADELIRALSVNGFCDSDDPHDVIVYKIQDAGNELKTARQDLGAAGNVANRLWLTDLSKHGQGKVFNG